MTRTIVASATREIIIGFDQPFCVIGERINPTGRKKLAAEMIAGNFDTVIKDALEQAACGATMLDVNAGVTSVNPNETEPGLLVQTLQIVQDLVDLPLAIDSSVSAAIEAALKVAKGRPLVNSVTGETRVHRVLGSFDCGRILNPKTARSQFRGGIIMGLGMALMEDTQFDERNGRIMNPSLSEYHVPVHMDVPEIDVIWTDIADPHTPMGAHGVGEIGITGVGAAVANAIYNATGKRVRDLPITLDKLL